MCVCVCVCVCVSLGESLTEPSIGAKGDSGGRGLPGLPGIDGTPGSAGSPGISVINVFLIISVVCLRLLVSSSNGMLMRLSVAYSFSSLLPVIRFSTAVFCRNKN